MSATSPPAPTPEPPSGLCACGCGEPAPIAVKTDTREGWIRGQPKRYVHGHRARLQSERVETLYELADSGCWIWTGNTNPYGYGLFGDRLAHRVIWTRHIGPLDRSQALDHLCHQRETCEGGRECPHRRCVNPAHLQVATLAVNTQRGRKSKLTLAQVRTIRASDEPPAKIAARFGISPSNVSNIRARRTWRNA